MPGICYVEQNLFLAYVMLDKTYSQQRLCSTKPIPGTVKLHWLKHLWDHENQFETGIVRASEG